MESDVVSHHEVAQIARAVPEHGEAVPEALTPKLGGDEAVDPRNECGHNEYADKDSFVLCRSPFKPWRHHRDDQVQAYERVHEPQVAGHRREVERQPFEVGEGLLPLHSAPQQRKEGVEHHEHQHRREYPGESLSVELSHRHSVLHRDQQECRHDHEKRNAGPCHKSVIERYPEAVCFIGKHRHVACQTRAVRSVKILAGMDQHHKETCDHADVVDEGNPSRRLFPVQCQLIVHEVC